MSITTSYFAINKYQKGKKISVARFNHPRIRRGIDEIITSFAPSSELLYSYKDGKIDWREYKNKYLAEQREHYKAKPEDFENILERARKERLVLLCYEKFEGPKTKCHRFILYDILKKISINKGINVDFFDEIKLDKSK